MQAIDRVATDFGMPMGPLRLVDEVGIDVSAHAGEALHQALGERLAPSPVLVELGKTDRLGKKGGLGFYRYEKGEDKGVDENVYAHLPSVSGRKSPDELTDDDRSLIRRRLLLAMVNEATRILDDGIVASAQEVDLAMIMGTGFPPFRGGLLRFADTLHPRGVLARLEEMQREHGARYAPAPALVRIAERDQTFYEAFPGSMAAALA